jgi:hypothetical protein
LRRGLSDLQLLGHALACHVARPSRWRRQTSLQTGQRISTEVAVCTSGDAPGSTISTEVVVCTGGGF